MLVRCTPGTLHHTFQGRHAGVSGLSIISPDSCVDERPFLSSIRPFGLFNVWLEKWKIKDALSVAILPRRRVGAFDDHHCS